MAHGGQTVRTLSDAEQPQAFRGSRAGGQRERERDVEREIERERNKERKRERERERGPIQVPRLPS